MQFYTNYATMQLHNAMHGTTTQEDKTGYGMYSYCMSQ